MEFTVQCESRQPGAKPNAMRRSGQIPAVLYGHDGTNAVSLTVPAKTVEVLLKSVAINNSIVSVQVPSLSLDCKSLLRDVQSDPVSQNPLHLSFFSVASQSSIQVTVPIHTVGTPKGVEFGGGTLEVMLSELELSCSPTNIPETVEIEVTHLKVGDSLHVDELTLPEGAVSVGEPGRLVLSITGKSSGVDADDEAEAASAAAASAAAAPVAAKV
jgi:large subunit ribosomal protein L25